MHENESRFLTPLRVWPYHMMLPRRRRRRRRPEMLTICKMKSHLGAWCNRVTRNEFCEDFLFQATTVASHICSWYMRRLNDVVSPAPATNWTDKHLLIVCPASSSYNLTTSIQLFSAQQSKCLQRHFFPFPSLEHFNGWTCLWAWVK